MPFNVKTKKEEAINLREKYFHSYDNFCNNKQKETKNTFGLEIFSLL